MNRQTYRIRPFKRTVFLRRKKLGGDMRTILMNPSFKCTSKLNFQYNTWEQSKLELPAIYLVSILRCGLIIEAISNTVNSKSDLTLKCWRGKQMGWGSV